VSAGTQSNVHVAWARLFLRALASSGVRELVVSPGSRSTPLALAAVDEPSLRVHVLIDERTAAFFALGQARVTGSPSALVCTSGTAGAHYLPAIIEASLAHVPMVVVTADRPWESYDAAAPQTIDQVKLFGGHVRHYAELGLPEPSALAAAVRVASQAVHAATHPTPGPVHVNARFRKPLEPVDRAGPEPFEAEAARLMARGAPSRVVARASVSPADLGELAALCAASPRGLIVAGPAPLSQGDARGAAARLSAATGYPLLPEATSQLRFGGAGGLPGDARASLEPEPESGAPLRCERFDAVLRSPAFRARHAPDVIIELGLPPVSGAYAAFLGEHRAAARWVVAPHGWNDPVGGASGLVWAEAADALGALAQAAERDGASAGGGGGGGRGGRGSFGASFRDADAQAAALVARELERPGMSEGGVVASVIDALPSGALLLVGNSMPVRDLDTYAPSTGKAIGVLHQRGASGIDGLVSAAAGAASVADGRPVALLLGDLSMLHDVAGLNAARGAAAPLLIVAVQNDGGRIFEQLPVARRPEAAAAFERLFITSQGVSFEHAAALFGVAYERVADRASLAAALARGLDRGGPTVVEAVVPPTAATALRAELHRDLSARLGAAL
jgi:2-succinyl-5-enolpyruvyl-6-hydroxy-3-cyclohexene-1-carboxylate synthase